MERLCVQSPVFLHRLSSFTWEVQVVRTLTMVSLVGSMAVEHPRITDRRQVVVLQMCEPQQSSTRDWPLREAEVVQMNIATMSAGTVDTPVALLAVRTHAFQQLVAVGRRRLVVAQQEIGPRPMVSRDPLELVHQDAPVVVRAAEVAITVEEVPAVEVVVEDPVTASALAPALIPTILTPAMAMSSSTTF